MRLEEFSLKEPFWVVVVALLVAVLGVVCLVRMPKDILPLFKTPAVQIVTFYPGMPADVMEKDITTRLERWTGQSNGIAMQESRSMTGVSIVKDYFRPDIDPNTAMAQVTSYAMSDLYYLPPGTIPPMVMPFDPTASIPLALLTVDNPTMNETQLYDVGYFTLRNMLQGISGVIAPAVYGGTLRRILAYVDPEKLAALQLSPLDVVRAMRQSNVLIPTGNAKLGDKDFQVVTNAMEPKVENMNRFLIRGQQGVPVTIGDVGKVEDTHQIQTNVVRVDGQRRVYIPIYRQPGGNTIEIIDKLKAEIKSILERLPKGMVLKVVADQSKFVREAVKSLSMEVGLGGILSALVVLLFLWNLRASFAVFLSIPLSILACFMGLYFNHQSLNVMTLGGLALAVGPLIDDSIVVLENTIRYRERGVGVREAAIQAAREVSMPVLAATVTMVIVFLPVVFLTGIGKYLFTPLAMSVAFSIGASYVVSMTLIPLFCATFLKTQGGAAVEKEGLFEKIAAGYEKLLSLLMRRKKMVLAGVTAIFAASFLLYPLIGKELFPRADVGYMTLYLRMPTGTRIELTEKKMGAVEARLKELIGEKKIKTMITNIGVLYEWPAAYTPNSGPGDTFIELELSDERDESTESYAQKIREDFALTFPDVELSINTGGMVTSAMNMGLASPINIQVAGKEMKVLRQIAEEIVARAKKVRGAVDVRIQERLDYPQIDIELNREAITAKRLTVEEVVQNIVTPLNSSVNFLPAFWIDPSSGIHYFMGAQYPEEKIESLETLKEIPLTGKDQIQVVRLKDLANFKETTAASEIRHSNIQRVVNVFANTSGRDLGSVAEEIRRQIADIPLPEGVRVYPRGEIESMRDSFQNLVWGLLLAVLLVYLVLVGQFRSFRDPLLILVSVPMGLIGVFLILWLTQTTFNIQALIGVIFMVGIAVSNGILLIDFANRLKREGKTPEEAALQAAKIRLRPIVMTTVAVLLGLLPMSIGFGHGAEANTPLGRAVMGGLCVSAFLTLLVLPLLYVGIERLKLRRTAVFLFALVWIGGSWNMAYAEQKVFSYEEALQRALAQNPQVILAKARQQEAAAEVTIARAAYWPRLNLSAMDAFGLGGSSQATSITGLVNSPFRKGFGGGLDAAWTVFDFGRTGFQVQAKAKEAQAREIELAQHLALIRLAVTKVYGEAVYYEGLDRLFHERESRQQALVDEIANYVKSGITSPVELQLAQASLEQTKVRCMQSVSLSRQSRARIQELMGEERDENYSYIIPIPSVTEVDPGLLSDLIVRALRERPEILAAQKRVEATRAQKKAAQWERAPRFVAVSSVGALEDVNLVDHKEWATGVGVTLPLFDGFRMEGETKKATEQEFQAQAELLRWRNQIRQEVASAYAQWSAAKEARAILEKQFSLAEAAYNLAHQRYTDKAGTFAELRDAESVFDQAAQEKWSGEMNDFWVTHQLLVLTAQQ